MQTGSYTVETVACAKDGVRVQETAPQPQNATCKRCLADFGAALNPFQKVLGDAHDAAIDVRVQAYPTVIKAKERFMNVCDKDALRVLRSALEDAERTVAGIALYGPRRFYGSGVDVASDLVRPIGFIAGNLDMKSLIEAGKRFDRVIEAAVDDARKLTPASDDAGAAAPRRFDF